MAEPGPWRAAPLVPVAWGELLDKMSILRLKVERLPEPARRARCAAELAALEAAAGDQGPVPEAALALGRRLGAVNAELWGIEDELRRLDAAGDHGPGFVALARAVPRGNARRSALKREIDELMGSAFREEKQYAGGAAGGPAGSGR